MSWVELTERCVVLCAGEKVGEDDKTAAETGSLKSRYEQTARERDEAQRAYSHARQEVDALLYSLQEMKAERDEALSNYQNLVRAPASVSVGWVLTYARFVFTYPLSRG